MFVVCDVPNNLKKLNQYMPINLDLIDFLDKCFTICKENGTSI